MGNVRGFRIEAQHFVAGGEAEQGICTRAAPIIKYMIGWSGKQVADYCKQKGWIVQSLPDGRLNES